MNKKQITCLAIALLIGVGRSLAAATDSTATVTEAVNEVNYGAERSTQTYPAKTGTPLHDGQYLKTGKASRAELLLPSTSVTRLGANTIFNYSLASNEIDLQEGTILFCKPKDAKQQLNIKTAAISAGIVGTTGFSRVSGKSYLFGLIEGKANVHADGKIFLIHGGEELNFTPGSAPVITSFDIPRMVRTSSLLHGFKRDLPNKKYIDEAVANYIDDENRGFIRKGAQIASSPGSVPTVPIVAIDSALRAGDDQHRSNNYP